MPVLATIDGHTRHGRAAPAQVAALLSYYDAINKTYYWIYSGNSNYMKVTNPKHITSLRTTAKTATTTPATAKPAIAPTLGATLTMGEKLVGATVGLITQKTGWLQVVLQTLRGGKGHNKFTMQPKVKQYTISVSFRTIMNTMIITAKQNKTSPSNNKMS